MADKAGISFLHQAKGFGTLRTTATATTPSSGKSGENCLYCTARVSPSDQDHIGNNHSHQTFRCRICVFNKRCRTFFSLKKASNDPDFKYS